MKASSLPSLLAGGVLGAFIVATATLLPYGQRARAAEPAIPPGAALHSWYENGQGGRYLLQLVHGRPLAAGERLIGIVRTDSTCRPDAEDLSHCHNAIDLANGARIVVVNSHQMSRNRCLAPGDEISIRALNPGWVIGRLNNP